MIVPTSQCGSIIGRQGTRIREIREKTGCNVRIANDLLPNSSEKLITLYGEPRVIESCVEAICHVSNVICQTCKTTNFRSWSKISLMESQIRTLQGHTDLRLGFLDNWFSFERTFCFRQVKSLSKVGLWNGGNASTQPKHVCSTSKSVLQCSTHKVLKSYRINIQREFSRNINNNIQHYAQPIPHQSQWSQNGQNGASQNNHHLPHIQHQSRVKIISSLL